MVLWPSTGAVTAPTVYTEHLGILALLLEGRIGPCVECVECVECVDCVDCVECVHVLTRITLLCTVADCAGDVTM